MELGNKIKSLRLAAKMTQEELAAKLDVSSQAVSKWETNASTPDIYTLPKLSVIFGVTIDELFDLTVDDKLKRIENMFMQESALSDQTFQDTKAFLFDQLESYPVKGRIEGLIARLYHLRMEYDSEIVSKYARECMEKLPSDMESNAEWLLQKAEGAASTDYNVRNHNKTILFYKKRIEQAPEVTRNYLELMDNLLADHRTKEAWDVLDRYRKLKDSSEIRSRIYELRISFCEGDPAKSDECAQALLADYSDDYLALFELGGYYADRCNYEKALMLFERSYEAETKPRYVDALQAEAVIYEILGDFDKAAKMQERVIMNLKDEWNTDEGAAIDRAMAEIDRLRNMSTTG